MSVQSQNQSGRSMVEMLGVLAVIGVLSVGGVAGYRYAMDKYRSGQLVSAINFAAMQFDELATPSETSTSLKIDTPVDFKIGLLTDWSVTGNYVIAANDKSVPCLYGVSFTLPNTEEGLKYRQYLKNSYDFFEPYDVSSVGVCVTGDFQLAPSTIAAGS